MAYLDIQSIVQNLNEYLYFIYILKGLGSFEVKRLLNYLLS